MARVVFDAILSIAFGSITTSFTNVGSPLSNNWRVFKITNNTDGDMMFSLNGTTSNIFVAAGGFTLYDLAANAPNIHNSDAYVFSIGTQFSIKYISAPTKGNVYIEGAYAPGV